MLPNPNFPILHDKDIYGSSIWPFFEFHILQDLCVHVHINTFILTVVSLFQQIWTFKEGGKWISSYTGTFWEANILNLYK